MDERTENRIEGWESKPLTGGFAELRELTDGGFSGVVRARGTTLFVLNGRVVGVFGGSIDDFADAQATAYQAPHPSLPLLFAMQEYGGEQQAKYYTNDTPISEAHQQLSDAQFTGYIELSENVLSGDYYVVYYGGRSMSCAFVGNAERLETGDEAFQLADDEVGIYEVMSVEIEVTDIPEPGSTTGRGDADPDSTASPGDADASSTTGPGDVEPGRGTDAAGTGAAGTQGTDSGPGVAETGTDETTVPGTSADDTSRTSADDAAATGADETATPSTDDPVRTGTDVPPDGADEPAEQPGTSQPPAEPDPGSDTQEHPRSSADAEQDRAVDATGSHSDPAADDPDAGTAPRNRDGATGSRDVDAGAEPRDSDPRPGDQEPADAAGADPGVRQGTNPDGISTPADRAASDTGAADLESTADGVDARSGSETPAGRTDETGTASDAATGASSESEPEIDSRTETAADRAVEAASGPEGAAATGTATPTEGIPKSEAVFGDLRPIPSLSPGHTRVAEPGEESGAEADAESSSDRRSPSSGAEQGTTSSGGDHDQGGTSNPRGQETTSSAGGRESTPSADGRETTSSAGTTGRGGSREASADGPDRGGTDVTERASQEVDVDVETGDEPEPVSDDAGVSKLRQQLQTRAERIEELEAALTDLRVQRDGLTDERDRLETEVERLEGEVSDLEAEIERLQSRLKDGTEGKRRLSPEDALRGTNLFIRYDSKSGGTLDKAHGGEVDADEVNENLRLEHHTQFDADEVVVDDDPFDDFLRGTVYRGFVEWVVRNLLYEIQDTGHVKGLRELYDAIPRIDRAELLGEVSVQFTEDGEEYREQRSFDVVLRDRMGNPLIVANINDSRNPADREMMEAIIENSIDVKESNESLSSSMMVTSSFFEPGALEAADEAAGGGLLSRDAKESYVKLNRKSGYHLILVESRESDFHVNVPEL